MIVKYDENYFNKYGGVGYTPKTTVWYLRPFARAISNLVSLHMKLPIKILDIGCAKGYLVKMLRENRMEAWGIDISQYAIRNAPDEFKSYLHKVDVENENLPFQDKFFDLMISIAVFEHLHLRRLPFIMSEIHRVLKTGGLLIINVPNPLNKTETKKSEHITILTKKKWIRLIERLGFSYESKLSRLFDEMRVKEIVALYIQSHHSFQFMGFGKFYFPKSMKDIVTYLMVLKRKLLAPTFSLIFSRT